MRGFVKNQSTVVYTTGWTWKDVLGLTDDQLQNVYNKIRRAVDLATAKDHHQQLKRSGETLESSESKKLKSSHSTEQPAELDSKQAVPLRKSSMKKSMARKRTLPRPSQSETAALPFDEDDPEAEFKKATGIGLGLWSDLRTLITASEDIYASIIWDDQDQWEIRSWRFYALPAIHV
nr:hypothetical protein [Tanacetum cinerariifolium]